MHIAFEGPIGVGKTTLAVRFARHIGATVELEDFDGNKFLQDFYEDRIRWSLPMQLWFLIDRYQQLSESTTNSAIVSDHSLATDYVFAHTLLIGRELELYERISNALSNTANVPDVVVLLDAPNDILLSRIASRARPYETLINDSYLNELRNGYASFYSHHQSLIKIDTSTLDTSSDIQMNRFFSIITSQINDANGNPPITTR